MACEIISVVNQKGGVGKTTTAINLSAFLSEGGFRTLLIDLDAQGNATSGIGLKSTAITASVYHLIVDNAPLSDVLCPSPFRNLHVIPATNDLSGAEIELAPMVSRESRLQTAIAPLHALYDYIIIDCPPSLGLLTVNALVASRRAIIPVQCEYFALEGLAGLVHTLTRVQESFNPDLSILGILLTMYDKRTVINRMVEDNARAFFEGLVFKTVIPRNTRLAEAPSHGLPIALYHPACRGSIAYYDLSKEVIERV